MALTLAEIKDLIVFGQDLGLTQLQTQDVVVVYGQKPGILAELPQASTTSETENLLAHYSAVGRGALKGAKTE